MFARRRVVAIALRVERILRRIQQSLVNESRSCAEVVLHQLDLPIRSEVVSEIDAGRPTVTWLHSTLRLEARQSFNQTARIDGYVRGVVSRNVGKGAAGRNGFGARCAAWSPSSAVDSSKVKPNLPVIVHAFAIALRRLVRAGIHAAAERPENTGSKHRLVEFPGLRSLTRDRHQRSRTEPQLVAHVDGLEAMGQLRETHHV